MRGFALSAKRICGDSAEIDGSGIWQLAVGSWHLAFGGEGSGSGETVDGQLLNANGQVLFWPLTTSH
jgi:hypothetical protein